MFGKGLKPDADQEVNGLHKPNDKESFDDFNKPARGEVYQQTLNIVLNVFPRGLVSGKDCHIIMNSNAHR